ncbi:MAG TPA: thioredoxin family protein [Terriglobales bacterium]|nr:thioredoxin family protein [Terriglobales bacterium]
MLRSRFIVTAILLLSSPWLQAQRVPLSFAPLEQWRAAIAAGNWKQAQSFYAPAVEVVTAQGKSYGAAVDVNFWKDQGAAGLALDVADVDHSQGPDTAKITFEAEYKQKAPLGPRASGLRAFYVVCAQVWQRRGTGWRIVSTAHGDPTRLKQPLVLIPIFSATADARADIRQALTRATRQNKRVLLDFGANWCFDCHVLDTAFESSAIRPLLQKNFVVVHVDVGQYDKNLDLAQQYQIPLQQGVPALAVLNAEGKLLFSSQHKEFEKARSMSSEEIVAFLNQWKPGS